MSQLMFPTSPAHRAEASYFITQYILCI